MHGRLQWIAGGDEACKETAAERVTGSGGVDEVVDDAGHPHHLLVQEDVDPLGATLERQYRRAAAFG